MREHTAITEDDSLLAVTTLSFDIAALELYLPLITGARLVLASRETAADGEALSKCLADCRITLMQATPATWRLLLEARLAGKRQAASFVRWRSAAAGACRSAAREMRVS